MSSRIHTPLAAITDGVESRFKLITRSAYLEALSYLVSLSSNFEVDGTRIEQIDHNQTWPTGFEVDRYNNPTYIEGLLKYRAVPLGIHLNKTMLSLKFPVVLLRGSKVSTYQVRQWKRYNATHNHIYYEQFETKAFSVHRLPTKEEFLTAHSYVYSSSSSINNVLSIYDDVASDVSADMEEKFKKYSAALKRSEHYGESSKDLAYKTYIKYRGNAAFDKWKAENNAKFASKKIVTNEHNARA